MHFRVLGAAWLRFALDAMKASNRVVAAMALLMATAQPALAGDEIKALCSKGALRSSGRPPPLTARLDECEAKVKEEFYRNGSGEGFRCYIRFECPLPEEEVVRRFVRDRTPHQYDHKSSALTQHMDDPGDTRLLQAALKERLAHCNRYYEDGGHSGAALAIESGTGNKLVYHWLSWIHLE